MKFELTYHNKLYLTSYLTEQYKIIQNYCKIYSIFIVLFLRKRAIFIRFFLQCLITVNQIL